MATIVTLCPTCRGLRWVCENHPDHPWDGRCCGGAGAPCPTCNVPDEGHRPKLPLGFQTEVDYQSGPQPITARQPQEIICHVLRSARIESPFGETDIADHILRALDIVGYRVSREDLTNHQGATVRPALRENLRYSIEVFSRDDALLEVLGRIGSLDVARAAFAKAVQQWPYKFILLRQGGTVLASSDRMEGF
jgi:hypothetical protein